MGRRWELRPHYWRHNQASWLFIAMVVVGMTFWPPLQRWYWYLAAGLVAFALVYSFVFPRTVAVTVGDGVITVRDLVWPTQTMPIADAARMHRRRFDGYWEVISDAGEVLRIRPVWRRALMEEFATLIGVEITEYVEPAHPWDPYRR